MRRCRKIMDKITDNIKYGSTLLEYTIEFCERRTLGIIVNPDCSIYVKAPENASLEKIRDKIHLRAAWISKQKRYFESFGIHTPKRKYISGESHLYLGRQYMLRVIRSEYNRVNYKNNIIEIECRNTKNVGILLNIWYKQRAIIKFNEYTQPIIEHFNCYGVKPKEIIVHKMDTRWGSCSKNGTITLNSSLIRAPRSCIEYVITHELCHLVHRNHTKAFYELLATEMPHWEKMKIKLERIMM